MDPLSISSAIGGLVTVCARTITTCRAIVDSLQDAPRILSSIQAECSTTREALSQIFMLINKTDTTALTHLASNEPLSQSFDIALTGCTVTFSVLDNELERILKHCDGQAELGFRQRSKFVWNEDVLKAAMGELRGQREALNLLVTVVQSHSIGEILDLLKAKSSVFQDVKRRTDSLYRPRGINGQMLDGRWDADTYSIFSDYTEKKFFDFDDDVMKSPAYRRVYSSVRSVRRPRRPQRTRLEPIVNLLDDEEDLIDLHDHPPLVPASYTQELENELSPSSIDRPPSTKPSTTSPNVLEDTTNGPHVSQNTGPSRGRESESVFSKTGDPEVPESFTNTGDRGVCESSSDPDNQGVPEKLINTDHPTEQMEFPASAGSPNMAEPEGIVHDSADSIAPTERDGVITIEARLNATNLEDAKSNASISDNTTNDVVPAGELVESMDPMKNRNEAVDTPPPLVVGDANPAPSSGLTEPVTPPIILSHILTSRDPADSHFIRAARSGKSGTVRERLMNGVLIQNHVLERSLLYASLGGHTDIVELLLLRGVNVNCRYTERPMICKEHRSDTTPLHLAAADNRGPTVGLLLKCGADVTLTDGLGWTPLHFASARGCGSALRVLLEHKAPIEAGARLTPSDIVPGTPLHVAARFGSHETATILLESGANTNAKAMSGFTPLHSAFFGTYMEYPKVFREKLNFNNIFDMRILESKQSSIHIALLEHLLKSGCNPSTPDDFGITPLHLASMHSSDIARILIRHAKDVSAKSELGWTPLHIAALYSRDVGLAKLLIQAGADLEAPFDAGLAQLGRALFWGIVLTPLGIAVARANIDMVKYLLQMGAKTQMPKDPGLSVLHVAAMVGNTEMLVLLCKQGVGFKQKGLQVTETTEQSTEDYIASEECLPKNLRIDIDTRSSSGSTPLLWVIYNLEEEAIRMKVATRLLELGADAGACYPDPWRMHLLHFSDRLQRAEITQLVKAGAPLEAKDSSGLTPLLELVKYSSSPWKIEHLIGLGADIYAKDAAGMSAWALVSQRPGTLEHLIGLGADIYAKDEAGMIRGSSAKSEIKKILNRARKRTPQPSGWVE